MSNILYQIDPKRDIPIYQQLVDELSADIRSGRLTCGDKLPTVQEMADELDIARGTIKRAYDELEHQKLIEKIQGRGTFVCYHATDPGSRKEQAMTAIDELFDQMSALDFSLSEVRIFLDLKLRQREERTPNLKVAAVECNTESLSQMVEQLRQIGQIDLYSYLVDDVLAYPYQIEEEMDLIVTTTEHFEQLAQVLRSRDKLAQAALRLSTNYMTQLVQLQSGQKVGILTSSERFAQLMTSTCQVYADHPTLVPPRYFSRELDVKGYFSHLDAVLVPEEYERYCPRELHNALSAQEKRGKLIRCAYRIDDGSFIYLREKVGRLCEKRKI